MTPNWHAVVIVSFCVGFICGAIFALVVSPSEGRAMARKPRTLVVGDSLGVGTAPTLQKILQGRVDTDARVGRPSREGVAQLRRKMRGGNYSRVVFDLGTNDSSARETKRSLRQAKRIVGNTPLYVATVNGPDAKRKNRAIRNSGANVIDWASKGKTTDGLHPTAQGYKGRARMFKRVMRQGGSGRSPGGSLPLSSGSSAPTSSTPVYASASAPQLPQILADQLAKIRSSRYG